MGSSALSGRELHISYLSRPCGGFGPHTPGDGEFRPPGRVTFSTQKKSPKRRRGYPGPRFLSQSVSINGETSLPLNFVLLSNLQSDAQRCSACRPLKEIDVSISACRNMVLETHPREYPKDNRTSRSHAGVSKGGQASPFVSSCGWGT